MDSSLVLPRTLAHGLRGRQLGGTGFREACLRDRLGWRFDIFWIRERERKIRRARRNLLTISLSPLSRPFFLSNSASGASPSRRRPTSNSRREAPATGSSSTRPSSATCSPRVATGAYRRSTSAEEEEAGKQQRRRHPSSPSRRSSSSAEGRQQQPAAAPPPPPLYQLLSPTASPRPA